ncbi:hypothetical protein C943_01007 [Mariniradius saccharolyticus AK6]|uniref:Uncharacterized protein n=1 Tax=Mariniradius saccharolyticus AK6 TaxID=1239962 RepID=M7XCP8_9BACT|nr:hypothetical protein C943_01007 [Mariniradius saccharolyticus AK6]
MGFVPRYVSIHSSLINRTKKRNPSEGRVFWVIKKMTKSCEIDENSRLKKWKLFKWVMLEKRG